MIKLANIRQMDDNSIKADVLIEGEKNNAFKIVFNNNGSIISSNADDKQKYYEAQARIAFSKYVGKEFPHEICSMWYQSRKDFEHDFFR